MLHDTTCCICGGDCELDLEYMEDRYADPYKAPESERMWKCTRCGYAFTNSIMESIQKEREKKEDTP
jgi:C4-type Zn-finger protein